MISPIVQSKHGVTLLGGGGAAAADIAAALALAPCLVAADGGADHALAAGHMPEAVIGDFDSVSAAAQAAIPQARLHPVAEQESTDFGKCLALVEAPFYLALGFAGGRLDHTLAAMTALGTYSGRRVVLIGPEDLAFLALPRLALAVAAGTRVSLWPLGPASGTSRGLRWPIEGLSFAPGGRVGTSNLAIGPVELALSGPMLVLLPRDCLVPVLDALGAGSAVRGR